MNKLIILSIPGLSFLELNSMALADYPHLTDLTRRSQIAALNVRTPHRGLEDSYISLGAGAQAVAFSEDSAVMADKPVEGNVNPYIYGKIERTPSTRTFPFGEQTDEAFPAARPGGDEESDVAAGYAARGTGVVTGDAAVGGGTVAGDPARGGGTVAGDAARGGSMVTGDAASGIGMLTDVVARRGSTIASHIHTAGGAGQAVDISASGVSAATALSAASYTLATSETGRQLYQRFQRSTPPASAAVLVPQIASLAQVNGEAPYHASIGLLGDRLAQAGIKRYVYGNADSDVLRRYAPLMLMNSVGAVDGGDISSAMLVSDTARPFGVRMDYTALKKEVLGVAGSAVVLVELGDLYRLYREREAYSDDGRAAAKADILSDIDAFVGSITSSIGNTTGLWLFAPLVNNDALDERLMLAPALFYRAGEVPGLFTSDTTRRSGIGSYVDFAPTILSQLGLPLAPEMVGFPLHTRPLEQPLTVLERELVRTQTIYQLRPLLLYPYASYEIAALLLCFLLVLLRWKPATRKLHVALYILLLAPSVMLAMGWLAYLSIPVALGLFLIATIAIATAASRLPLLDAVLLICAATVLLILVDGLTGEHAIKHSVLGYDPMVGARYYGIGNEYMGILIGAALLGTAAVMQRIHSGTRPHIHRGRNSRIHERKAFPWILAIYALLAIYLAAPMLGTNAGGFITAVAAFGVVWLRHHQRTAPVSARRRGNRVKLALAVTLVLAVAIALFALVNAGILLPSGRESHIGRAMRNLADGQTDMIGSMIVRKLAMNWHLVKASIWSKVLLSSLLVISVLLLKPQGVFRRWRDEYPYLTIGFAATSIGALVAFAVNDSGIVAAATMIGYVAAPILLLKLQESNASHSP